MPIGTTRGSFPKGPPGESGQQRRTRYEGWLQTTRDKAIASREATELDLDPEHDAVMAQPPHGSYTRPSQKLAIRARCWQCVSGDDDAAGQRRIAECTLRKCPLWSVRPYMPKVTEDKPPLPPAIDMKDVRRGDFAARAVAQPGSRALSIKGYCFDCMGGVKEVNTSRRIAACNVGHCALWAVRPDDLAIDQEPL